MLSHKLFVKKAMGIRPCFSSYRLPFQLVVALATVVNLFFGFVPVPLAYAATLTVNSTTDPGDGICDANECTLREAINAANASPGLDDIKFNISGPGPYTITLASNLPEITSPVVIDGTTQPGFSGTPVIQLDGKNTSATTPGLNITAGSSTVRGLVINGFKGYDKVSGNCGHAIVLNGNGGNIIEGNYIGTDVTGTSAVSNAGVYTSDENKPCAGVSINESSNNIIGGTLSTQRNVISGNGWGIEIRGTNAIDNVVMGNFVGTDVTGSKVLGNGFRTIYNDKQVYWHTPGIRIWLYSGNNTIGGMVTGARNLISGNDPEVSILCGKNNKVQGNFIGTDITGTVNLGQYDEGVNVRALDCESMGNIIGGTLPQEGNLISGNGGFGGVVIWSSDGGNVSGTQVQGNYIGTDVSGAISLGNSYGIYVYGSNTGEASGITIGGTTTGARNVISGNENPGITMIGTTDSLIQGNYIGTDATGKVALPNSTGVALTSPWLMNNTSSNNIIGGLLPEARNVIAGNSKYGLYISGGSDNQVQGNYIGTDATGSVAIANGLYGIALFDGTNNTIGGTMPEARNVVSGNGQVGILISGKFATGNKVQGNYIGTDAGGLNPLGNGKAGVWVQDGSNNNIIGGMQNSAGNLIAFNNEAGVQVLSGTGNLISENAIFSNALLGIDLGMDGFTANDLLDADSGANDLQNYPILSSATVGSAGTKILGALQSQINTTYTVEFFSNNACDPSGYGEGQAYLDSINVTTDVSGEAIISVTLPIQVPKGQFLTATATDPAGNTSEFSACVEVVSANQPPTVGPITAPVNPVQINSPINISANFTDPDITDTHTASIDWGDGNITTGTVVDANGSGTVNGVHTYTNPGIYTITLTVTDYDSGIGTTTFQYMVVYDPNGGFVTGGGWINSPEGAYTPDPTLTGKATFGFVSKYQKGATIPTGNTEFQFHVAGMNFKSTSYDWLVIAGTKAQYKGTGTINGTGEYKFMLTATDGAPDKFRIKIWDKVTGDVIYDNQLGAEDTADPTTVIQGGSIVIHKAK